MSMTLDSAGGLLTGLSSISQSSSGTSAAASRGQVPVDSNPAYTVSLSSAASQGSASVGATDTLYNARGVTTDLTGQEIPQFQASIDANVSAIEMMLNGEYGSQLDELLNK